MIQENKVTFLVGLGQQFLIRVLILPNGLVGSWLISFLWDKFQECFGSKVVGAKPCSSAFPGLEHLLEGGWWHDVVLPDVHGEQAPYVVVEVSPRTLSSGPSKKNSFTTLLLVRMNQGQGFLAAWAIQ